MAKRSRNTYINELKENFELFPQVDTSMLNDIDLKKFKCRRRVLDLYVNSAYTLKEIEKLTGVSISEIKRLRDRALNVLENGQIAGYIVCLPNISLKKYERRTSSEFGYAGLFSQFLEKNLSLKKDLELMALGKKKVNGSYARGKYYKQIFTQFKKLAKDSGLDVVFDYPFSNSDGGLGAIRQYCIDVKEQYPISGTKVDYGNFSGQLLRQALSQDLEVRTDIKPYDYVQLDGHKIDTEIIVVVIDELGNETYLPLSRIWVIMLIDVASKAVLGFSISLAHNYRIEDVLECISSSFSESDDNESAFANKYADLPCLCIDGCKNRLFNTISFDNAYAHISKNLQDKLIDAGVQEVITNRPQRPRSNSVIERFFLTFEELSFHKWPTTTGSDPKDPRRQDSLAHAEKLKVSLNIITASLKKAISEYNNEAHSSNNARSPLEYISYCLDSKTNFPRYLSKEAVNLNFFFKRKYQVTIRSNRKQGHPPYIQFKGARYQGHSLKYSFELTGDKAIFEVDIRDIRYGKLFLKNGTYLDTLSAPPKWLHHPHSIKVRVAILKLIRERKIISTNLDLVSAYDSFLVGKIYEGRKNRNDVIDLRVSSGFQQNSSANNTFEDSNSYLKYVKHRVKLEHLSID